MTRFFPIALLTLVVAGLVLVGCDSTDSDTPEDELIVGTWTAASANVSVDTGTFVGAVDVPIAFADGDGEITIVFRTDGTYTLRVVGPISGSILTESVVIVEDGFDETTTGTYSLQSDGQIRFGGEVDVDYEFDGDDEFDLSVENTDEGRDALALLLGGSIDPDLLDTIEGASITFRRDS